MLRVWKEISKIPSLRKPKNCKSPITTSLVYMKCELCNLFCELSDLDLISCRLKLATKQTSCRVNQSSLLKWLLLQNCLKINQKTCFVSSKSFLLISAGLQKPQKLTTKVRCLYQCSKMQFITFQNFHIQTWFSQFLWFFSLKC